MLVLQAQREAQWIGGPPRPPLPPPREGARITPPTLTDAEPLHIQYQRAAESFPHVPDDPEPLPGDWIGPREMSRIEELERLRRNWAATPPPPERL